MPRRDAEDFRGRRAHDAGVDVDHRLRGLAADAAEPDPTHPCPNAPDAQLLVVAAELRDAADDDGVDAEDPRQLHRAGRVGAAALLEVLLLQHAVELAPLDHRIRAVADQVGHQHVGDAFADVLVAAEDVIHVVLHGRVVGVVGLGLDPQVVHEADLDLRLVDYYARYRRTFGDGYNTEVRFGGLNS